MAAELFDAIPTSRTASRSPPNDDHAVATASLLLPATLAARLGIEALANDTT